MTNLIIDQRYLNSLVEKICVSIDESGFLPDVVVGVGRGGSTPAVMISHYFDIPYVNLGWNSEGVDNETNCWLPEEAYNGKKILVVDDICSTGSTFEDICDDWDMSIRGLEDYQRWSDNVKFAALHVREGVEFLVDFIGEEILDEEVEYPWEKWWA